MTLHAIAEVQDRECQEVLDDIIGGLINELALAERGLKSETAPGGGKPAGREPGDPARAGAVRVALLHLRAARRVLNRDTDKVLAGHQPREIGGDRNPRWNTLSYAEFVEIYEESGLTVRDFAHKIGRSKTYINDIINGKERVGQDISERVKAHFVRLPCPVEFNHGKDTD